MVNSLGNFVRVNQGTQIFLNFRRECTQDKQPVYGNIFANETLAAISAACWAGDPV